MMSINNVKSWYAVTPNGTGKDNKFDKALNNAGWVSGQNLPWEAFAFDVNKNQQPNPPFIELDGSLIGQVQGKDKFRDWLKEVIDEAND